VECVGRREFLKKEEKNLNRRFIFWCVGDTQNGAYLRYITTGPKKGGRAVIGGRLQVVKTLKKKFFPGNKRITEKR
jgi:hypothetical protein